MALSLRNPSLRKSARKGFSLIEASVVLAIVGVVTAGIWTVMAGSKQAATSNSLHQQILLASRNIRDYFAGRALPTTALDMTTNYTTPVLRAAGVFPEDMCPANCVSGSITTIRNAYGGTATFALRDEDANSLPDANRFVINLTAIQKRGCIELGMRLSSRSAELGLVGYKVETNAIITSFPISLNTLDTQCTAAAAGSTLMVIFKTRN